MPTIRPHTRRLTATSNKVFPLSSPSFNEGYQMAQRMKKQGAKDTHLEYQYWLAETKKNYPTSPEILQRRVGYIRGLEAILGIPRAQSAINDVGVLA